MKIKKFNEFGKLEFINENYDGNTRFIEDYNKTSFHLKHFLNEEECNKLIEKLKETGKIPDFRAHRKSIYNGFKDKINKAIGEVFSEKLQDEVGLVMVVYLK